MRDDSTALLVMDMQEDIVAGYADAGVLVPAGRAIAAARADGLMVVYVKVEFRPDYPEISPRNPVFSSVVEAGRFVGDQAPIHPAIAPRPGDVVVIKKRVSAFVGSDLDVLLRSREIRTLVLMGVATSGVVLSTLRAAADLDYQLIVLGDCCADGDPEVHRVLLKKVFPRQAEVLDAESWERRLAG
jgi:nicotinamidase-related amidase